VRVETNSAAAAASGAGLAYAAPPALKLVGSWAAPGLYDSLVSRGTDGVTPTIDGFVPPVTTHSGCCALFNNPVGEKFTSPAGAARNNPELFFGTEDRLNPTVHNFAKACRALRRSNVAALDLWPFIAPGEGVGSNPDSEDCCRVSNKLLAALIQEGFSFFLVASGDGWDTLLATLGAGRFVILPCSVNVFGEEHVVNVLMLQVLTGPCFFVKGKHFSRWNQNRKASIASLVCFFELAGQKLDPDDVKALSNL
jgi:hypothetical protein